MPLFIPPARTIRVALLVCGKFSKRIVAEHGDYHSMFRRWLKSSLPPRSGITLSLEPYDIFQEKYPRDDELPKYDAVMITGSRASFNSLANVYQPHFTSRRCRIECPMDHPSRRLRPPRRKSSFSNQTLRSVNGLLRC
jgi:hypothetical protein